MAEIYNFSTVRKKEKKTSYRNLSKKKLHRKQNHRKSRYTLVKFWVNWKKVKIEVKGIQNDIFFSRFWSNYQKLCIFSGPVTLFFSQKCTRVHFVFYFIKFINFFGQASPRWCCRGSAGGWIENICFTKLID